MYIGEIDLLSSGFVEAEEKKKMGKKKRKRVASIIARPFVLFKLYNMSDNRKRPVPSSTSGFPSKRTNRLSYGMDRLTLNNDEAPSTMGSYRSMLDHQMLEEPQTTDADQAAEASTSTTLFGATYTHNEQYTSTSEPYIPNRPQMLLSRFPIMGFI